MSRSEFVRTITCTIMHGFQNNFGTVVALEEEKCLLKIFVGRLKVKVTGVKYRSKWSNTCIEIVQSITCTFMHGFQNKFAQLLPSRRKSAI